MDCCYLEQNDCSAAENLFPNVSSPEMFDSDAENDADAEDTLTTAREDAAPVANQREPSRAELIDKFDRYLLARINKFLSGVPPPPKHTISQSDCSEFLSRIQQNRQYFWTPYPGTEKRSPAQETSGKPSEQADDRINIYQRSKCTSRNLSTAFDACDPPNETRSNDDAGSSDNLIVERNTVKGEGAESSSTNDVANSNPSCRRSRLTQTDAEEAAARRATSDNNSSSEQSCFFYCTTSEDEVTTLTWPDAYRHKFHGIHYNRSRAVEDYENLTVKLCNRYIGAETQSTCNAWFSKQAPGSARKRSLLAKRECGQSPGKRLSHLAKRRRTFSSANLQGLGVVDKRQLLLNIKKPISRKGKSPRGKSPRGKSPRGKSPRGSAKKKAVRRLTLDGPSPRKHKLETSKRALFQSPPADRAGPSKLTTDVKLNPQTIKRALFPTPKKNETDAAEGLARAGVEETRKRKSEEELEGPRFKWAKSLSFDCPKELQNGSMSGWDERHCSGSILSRSDNGLGQARTELSDTHRKKLLWAVAEALRGKGIGMGHPRFKQYASNLARTIKRFMPDLENRNIPRKPGSTTDRMLKLAKHHVLFIVEAARPAK